MSYQIDGMRELQRIIRQIGKMPQKIVTKAARKGANIAKKAAKQHAPVESGDLKKGIILRGERSSVKGKKVFDIEMNPAMSDIFAKVSKSGKRSYYPSSQEYGFTINGKYTPGFNYMKRAIDENKGNIEEEIVRVATDEFDKLQSGGPRS